jgi:hypothetical protein
MDKDKFYIPIRSNINLKTGESVREMMEVSENQYLEFLWPYAEILAKGFVKKLIEKTFTPQSENHKKNL